MYVYCRNELFLFKQLYVNINKIKISICKIHEILIRILFANLLIRYKYYS